MSHWLTAEKGVHQFRFFLSNMRTPKSMTKQGYSSQLWCTHWEQEEPKLVYTLFCCKLVVWTYSDLNNVTEILCTNPAYQHSLFLQAKDASPKIRSHACNMHCPGHTSLHIKRVYTGWGSDSDSRCLDSDSRCPDSHITGTNLKRPPLQLGSNSLFGLRPYHK